MLTAAINVWSFYREIWSFNTSRISLDTVAFLPLLLFVFILALFTR